MSLNKRPINRYMKTGIKAIDANWIFEPLIKRNENIEKNNFKVKNAGLTVRFFCFY